MAILSVSPNKNSKHANSLQVARSSFADKVYYVYILASGYNGTLYIGVTNDIAERIEAHKQGRGSKFTTRYKVNQLVHYEVFNYIQNAIEREKLLKTWNRQWKINLIEANNPTWADLTETLNA